MKVRPAAPSDAAAIRAIAARPYAAGWTEEAYASEAARPGSVFLVGGDERVAGYVLARVEHGEARLLDFAAAEDGGGAGRALWGALLAEARACGAGRLTLEVSSGNARARRFYGRAGAVVVGRRPKFYNDGSDAVLMDLALP